MKELSVSVVDKNANVRISSQWIRRVLCVSVVNPSLGHGPYRDTENTEITRRNLKLRQVPNLTQLNVSARQAGMPVLLIPTQLFTIAFKISFHLAQTIA